MKYPISIRLSLAQYKFFEHETVTHSAMGDCRMCGLKLVMDDYEGALAMLGAFRKRTCKGRREVITRDAVIVRLNKAISKAMTHLFKKGFVAAPYRVKAACNRVVDAKDALVDSMPECETCQHVYLQKLEDEREDADLIAGLDMQEVA